MRSLKCVILGDGAVGKTSLLISYTTNIFPTEYAPTVFNNYSVTISVDPPSSDALINSNNKINQTVTPLIEETPASTDHLHYLYKLNLWDTAGQEEYDRLRPLSYPQTDIFLLCFSINQNISFKNLNDKWLPELKQHANIENCSMFKKFNKFPILLVGTKSDLRNDSDEELCIPVEGINKFVEDNHLLGYVECSAKCQAGITEIFQTAVRKLVYEYDPTFVKQLDDKIEITTTKQQEEKILTDNKNENKTKQSLSPLSSQHNKLSKNSVKMASVRNVKKNTTTKSNRKQNNKNNSNSNSSSSSSNSSSSTVRSSKSGSTIKKRKNFFCIII